MTYVQVRIVNNKVAVPVMPKSDWRSFQSQDNPTFFNYGHVHQYVLESTITILK